MPLFDYWYIIQEQCLSFMLLLILFIIFAKIKNMFLFLDFTIFIQYSYYKSAKYTNLFINIEKKLNYH